MANVLPYQGRRDLEVPRDWIALMPAAVELAKAVSNTDFVPKTLRGNPAAITAAILYGDEVGLGPMQALAKIAVVEGKPTLYAEAQRALILAAGHDLWVEESTTTRVTIVGRRKDSDQTNRATWTMDDAKRANLAGKPSWRNYPRQMLLARATGELARAVFADVIGGLAATEEIEEAGEPRAEVAPIEEKATTRRRRRTTSATVSGTTAEPQPEPALAPPLPGEDAPDPEPEAEPEPEPEPISEPQRKKLMALFNERGFNQRENRLAFTRVLIGRRISTSNELTMEEASHLIDTLERHDPVPDEPIGEEELLQQLKDTLDAQELPEEPS